MTENDDRGLLDDKAFNDPEAWGYCDYCAFEVAVYDGVLIEHRRFRNGADDSKCNGSGNEPVRPSPLVASARQRVSLRRSLDAARQKGYWQRQRYAARAIAREEAALKPPKPRGLARLTLVRDNGVEVDLTDSVSSVVLNPPHPEES